MTWQIVHTNGWLYAIDGWKPYVKWRYDIKSSGNTSVAGVTAGNNGRVYVATVTGRLYSLDTDTGNLLWQVIVGPLTNRTCFPKLDDKGKLSMVCCFTILFSLCFQEILFKMTRCKGMIWA